MAPKLAKAEKFDIFETIGSRAWIFPYAPFSGVLSSFLAVLSKSENCLPQSWGHMVSKMVPKLPKMLK